MASWNTHPYGAYPSVPPGSRPDEAWLDPQRLESMRRGPAYGLGVPYPMGAMYPAGGQYSPYHSPDFKGRDSEAPEHSHKTAAKDVEAAPPALAPHDVALPSPYSEGPKGLYGFGLYQILNFVWYVLNAFFVNTSSLGWYGATNTEQSEKYTTFLTPKGTAFSIWGLIYILEGLFTVYQLLPSQRGTDNALINRIGFFWVGAQIAQIIWTFVFAQDEVWAAWVFMALIYLFLGTVTIRLDPGRTDTLIWASYGPEWRIRTSPVDWFFYYFPFQCHFGWITAAFILNTNVAVVFEGNGLIVQVGTAIACLGIALASAVFWATIRRDMVHAFVIAWATYFISLHIVDPKTPLPLGTPNDADVTNSLSQAAAIVAVLTLLIGLITWGLAWTSYLRRWLAGKSAGAKLGSALY